MIRRNATVIASLVGFGIIGMCGLGCADQNMMAEAASQGGMAHYHSGTGELYRLYEYYPNQEVYRSVYNYHYFWREGGTWRTAPQLPEGVTVNEHDAKLIELPTGKPHEMHGDVLAIYPSLDQLRTLAAKTGAEPRGNTFATAPTDY